LHFPLENIIDGSGSAPICPPHPNFVKAMGRTNDAILFAGQVHLFVKGSDEAQKKLAREMPAQPLKIMASHLQKFLNNMIRLF